VITGGTGADTLDGGVGGLGPDTLIGGGGSDVYYVRNANDVVTDTGGTSDEIRSMVATYTIAAQPDIENLSFYGTGNFTGTGNSAANHLTGRLGNDTLDGGAGADTMQGSVGDDVYIVDNAGDVVVESLNEGIDLVKASTATYSLGANVDKPDFYRNRQFRWHG